MSEINLNTVGKQIKAEAHKAGVRKGRIVGFREGYRAAMADMSNTGDAKLAEHLAALETNGGQQQKQKRIIAIRQQPQRRAKERKRELQPGSLIEIVNQHVIDRRAHGVSSLSMKEFIRNGNSEYAGHPKLGKRVDTSLNRLKGAGFIIKRDDKWFPAKEGKN